MKAVLRGALGFAAVSVAAFSVWAFFGKRLTGAIGGPGMYAAVAAAFLALSGFVFRPARSYAAFLAGFAAYAVVWSAIWLSFHSRPAEWAASAAGTAAFAIPACLILGRPRSIPFAFAALFAGHSAGYFLGSIPYYAWKTQPAMLAWGAIYGLGFGAAIGFVLRPSPPAA